MSSADAQVINMVNSPHEQRARQKEQQRKARRRQARMRESLLRLTIKLELYIIAIGLLVIAAAHGAVADWLRSIGIALCIAGGAVELGQFNAEVRR